MYLYKYQPVQFFLSLLNVGMTVVDFTDVLLETFGGFPSRASKIRDFHLAAART